MSMKKIGFLIIIIIAIAVISNSLSSIYILLSKKNVIIKAQHELGRQEKENASLKKELNQTKTVQFVEAEARNKLFLVKPGEETILLPSPTPQLSGKPQDQEKPIPDWQQWLQLFKF